jgi:hypothetical protein
MKRLILIANAICVTSMSIYADLTAGQAYRISFVDVDGNALSIADGHITTLVLITQAGSDKARTVGDHVPDFCLGNPSYRMITVVAFEKKHSKPTRMILSSLMRRRLDSEGHRLQDRYNKLKISRDARHDVSATADFDGTITTQLGSQLATGLFHVFVFGKNGELMKHWSDVPSAEELTAALKQN